MKPTARICATVRTSFAKLRARLGSRGESIVETLAAVLICSLAILVMYTALTSAARMNAQADAQAAQVRESVIAAEMQESSGGGVREVRVSGFEEVYWVEYFAAEDGSFASYKLS